MHRRPWVPSSVATERGRGEARREGEGEEGRRRAGGKA